VLVDIYASMSTEELVCGMPFDFQKMPGQMLCDLITLAAATERKALRIRATEPFTADECALPRAPPTPQASPLRPHPAPPTLTLVPTSG
jgi:hypothetical protein